MLNRLSNYIDELRGEGKIDYDVYLNLREMSDQLEDENDSLHEKLRALETSDASKELSSVNYYNEMREWKDRAKEAERRAAITERALELCETAYILALNGKQHEGISQQAIVSDLGVHKFFIEQAEKELSEEQI